MASERYPLRQVIFDDLINHNKLALFLLLLLTITGVVTVWLTHQTRLLISEKEHLIAYKNKLNDQYLHMQLEENNKTFKQAVEAKAKSFGMRPISKDQEIIIVE
ncbi:Cell division protein FtsL [Phocoenobacter uteri]|uniref:Cell division protein FtsL n=1 Tax=Phocoenobacter uteri TaxID=146806 RepID=A0A379CBT1_9PAST|nr:cell division protein FtsL [Phocoenobacter uteri]MDG6881105.1 cell division protein FtsL [Phocoenobacter uteri]SUB59127.1 Cell division protein FtsL [Phocoenobacter uteri]